MTVFKSTVRFFLFVLISILFSSCATYTFIDGSKWKNFAPVKDERIVSVEDFNQNHCSLDDFAIKDSICNLKFIVPQDLLNLSDSLESDLLVIFHYPNCSRNKGFDLAKYAEDNRIPYVLVSTRNSPSYIKSWYDIYKLKKSTQYIIPTMKSDNVVVLKKKIDFIRKLSPELYLKHKDYLLHTDLLIISKTEKVKSNPLPMPYIQNKDSLINWIELEYDMKN